MMITTCYRIKKCLTRFSYNKRSKDEELKKIRKNTNNIMCLLL